MISDLCNDDPADLERLNEVVVGEYGHGGTPLRVVALDPSPADQAYFQRAAGKAIADAAAPGPGAPPVATKPSSTLPLALLASIVATMILLAVHSVWSASAPLERIRGGYGMKSLATAIVLLVFAVLLAVIAVDALRWRSAVASGDRQFARSAASATWKPHTVLPAGTTRDLLGLGTQLRFRAAEQSFEAVQAAGNGYDNGLSESLTRGELEGQLAGLARSRNRAIASRADNLLGILAFADATPSGPSAPAPVDASVADFQAAVRLDANDADAKFNLELVLRKLLAIGSRHGSDNSTGGGSTRAAPRGRQGGAPSRERVLINGRSSSS